MPNEKKESSEETAKLDLFKGRFVKAMGKRKTACAQVRLYKKGTGEMIINNMKPGEYFTADQASVAIQPLKFLKVQRDYNVSVLVRGGGKSAQCEAVRNGLAKALMANDDTLRPMIKAKDWLTRDARKKERKKPGLKKARKAPQWSKR
ncbi:30S ribosomal protein S9 [Candidatus Falkowbacteria bacterium CG_4_10_14_0_2_um_filter_48_10]|uniref:30S ribosomal protein S9 n=1 Tax=Candidatus Falkowbacteria bacterium CG23_combo_of_CG06-09_8_20_14_all_49_15 TaxID=1974572 RepID=A0A2G9ZKE6_9BACT|nr:MAG: 30S ribosomal protein S9 [Candidatus Falkowbacteria bacterium CG23_combo_of_CG06-09_8_20_14_all_49_15]PJA09393.1 MAG: 30S ribosomal protein S9 [Candidatus Falkowbacteria bacterium CG_4_10_14_0_2_um_filter_48_10]